MPRTWAARTRWGAAITPTSPGLAKTRGLYRVSRLISSWGLRYRSTTTPGGGEWAWLPVQFCSLSLAQPFCLLSFCHQHVARYGCMNNSPACKCSHWSVHRPPPPTTQTAILLHDAPTADNTVSSSTAWCFLQHTTSYFVAWILPSTPNVTSYSLT